MQKLDIVSYYWFNITILTFFWEIFFIYNYHKINQISIDFINNNKHVWTNNYSLLYILPWNLPNIFYAEYGAYADREYMSNDLWSREIEGTHAFICGIFSLFAIYSKSNNYNTKFLICSSISMGSKLMNSILYMGEYFIQINDSNSVNYNSNKFPVGKFLSERPFIYVNVFWSLCPLYVIIKSLYY